MTYSREAEAPLRRRSARVTAGWLLLPALGLLWPTSGCEPEVVVGDWSCATASSEQADGEAGAPSSSLAIEVPWSTSFEDGFCGYAKVRGFCYADADPA